MSDVTRIRIGLALAIFVLALGGYSYVRYKDSVSPANISFAFPKEVKNGELFDVPLKVSTTVQMNAAEFYYTFPSDLLEVEAIDQRGSFIELWIKEQPDFDNKLGLVSFAGGLPKPGFTGKDGLVATVRFRAKKSGIGSIVMDTSKSRILANDGLGSKIDASFDPISFTIR